MTLACTTRSKKKSGEVKNPFGEDSSGRMVHVSKVEHTGLRCKCICSGCKTPLVAYKNVTNRVQYFGHAARQNCRYASETAMHRYAKQVIQENHGITYPEVFADDGTPQSRRYPSKWVKLDQVVLEHRYHEIIPDVLATTHDGKKTLLIEVAVTHRSEDRKKAVLAQHEISAIEIDLSRLPVDASEQDIADAILRTGPRVWLFNPRITDAERKRNELARLSAEKSAAPVLALINRGIAQVQKELSAVSVRFRRVLNEITVMELDHLIGIPGNGDICFSAGPREWQACVLHNIVWGYGPIHQVNSGDALGDLLRRHLVKPEVRDLTEAGVGVVREVRSDFETPEEVITSYITSLVNSKFLDERAMTKSLLIVAARRRVNNAKRLAEEAAEDERRAQYEESERVRAANKEAEDERRAEATRRHNEQQLRKARRKLQTLVEPLLSQVSVAARKRFQLDYWMAESRDGFSPESRMMTPWLSERFTESLQRLKWLFEVGAAPAETLLGLPLEEVQAARVAERQERQAKIEKLERESRKMRLKASLQELGFDDGWQNRSDARFGGRTPLEAGEISDEMFERILGAAVTEGRKREQDRAVAARLERQLREIAAAVLGAAKGNLWMDSTSRTLRMKPTQRCTDAKWMRTCLETLERDTGKKIPLCYRNQ